MTKLTTSEFLHDLSAGRRDDDVVIAAMNASLLWPQHSDHELDLGYMAPMGSASSFGLGVALGRPDLGVIVIDGDGSLLMNFGSLVTVGGQRPARFLHIVLENGGYAVTGGQPLPGLDPTPLPEVALALGFAKATRYTGRGDLVAALQALHGGEGPILLGVPVLAGYDRNNLQALTHTDSSLRTLGPPGYARLRRALQTR